MNLKDISAYYFSSIIKYISGWLEKITYFAQVFKLFLAEPHVQL